jgi:pilus assembly protein CpaB
MNRRLLTILSCALIISAGATYIVYRIVGRQMMKAAAAPATSRVVVAARTLQIGSVVQQADLKVADWVGAPPAGIILAPDKVIGRGVVSTIYEGEPLMDTRLAAVGSGGGLAATIPPGMRACAVKVNEVVGVAGFVLPGMRVDVLIAGNPPGPGNASGPKVKTLLQNIEVLSAGTNIQKDNEGKPVQTQVVNLLVTPEQAEVLSLASSETRIQLVLRNPMDTQLAKTTGSGMANLFGEVSAPAPKIRAERPIAVRKPTVETPPPAAAKPAPTVYLIEVLNGGRRSEAKFESKAAEEKP